MEFIDICFCQLLQLLLMYLKIELYVQHPVYFQISIIYLVCMKYEEDVFSMRN